jgi:hypothetical protein
LHSCTMTVNWSFLGVFYFPCFLLRVWKILHEWMIFIYFWVILWQGISRIGMWRRWTRGTCFWTWPTSIMILLSSN